MQRLETMRLILRELMKIDPEFQLQWAIVFSEIAMHEGCSLKQISDKTGISMSVMSRTIGALSDHRRMGASYKLVHAKPSAIDRRQKELYLTAKGRALVDSLIDIVDHARAA